MTIVVELSDIVWRNLGGGIIIIVAQTGLQLLPQIVMSLLFKKVEIGTLWLLQIQWWSLVALGDMVVFLHWDLFWNDSGRWNRWIISGTVSRADNLRSVSSHDFSLLLSFLFNLYNILVDVWFFNCWKVTDISDSSLSPFGEFWLKL